MATPENDGQTVSEYVVRVPNNSRKRYSIMAFNAADKVDFSTWHRAKMERDLSNKKLYQQEEMPEYGAGSEFKRKLRDDAKRKKYGRVTKAFKPEDQPWLLKVNGKTGKRFKGMKKGGVTENASYYIFTQCPDGTLEAFPVENWYNFTPLARYQTLTAEEAEQEWERRNKILNHFSIMQQRRLKGQDPEEEEEGEDDRKKKSRNGLRIHDLEDNLNMSSDDSDDSGEEGEKAPKAKKEAAPSRRDKKKGSGVTLEDSDDGDFESQEVDYMSDSSSSSLDEVVGKAKVVQPEEDGPKSFDEESESSEESEEEKPPEEEEKKAPTPQEKKRTKGDSSEESETSEESDFENQQSAIFVKKKTTPKREWKTSGSSSRGDRKPDPPSVDSGPTSSTPWAAANKLGKQKRGPSDMPATNHLGLDAGPQRILGKSTPQPQSMPSSGKVQLTEDTVRYYLKRKPMTTRDLLKKFQKTGLSSGQIINMLVQILKRLNPQRNMINGKMCFFLV
ncbi:general transcription factor IIF subunit 1-like [Dromiciops gliroides]|uniref:general transcription factor IIF subunit 1-like n=1 Tax=Dromiciops gliroides TaxID=33562 RepID=UPI001CC5A0D6|nr:general transcription factor IIF subunit 1-like [Dromiciops gliroides]